jgi:soluble lytic murein transglycosylase-like protein/tetratricopeptide (TPR) repeat protein
VHHISYARELQRWLPKKAASLAFALMICSASTGCAPAQHQPLTVAFGGFSYSPDSAGLADMLRQSEGATFDEQKSSLRMFADSSVDAQAKQKANYVFARLLQKHGDKNDMEEAIKRYKEASQFPPLFLLSQNHIAECAAVAGDEKIARAALTTIASNKTLDAKARASALYGLGQSSVRAGERDKAREYFEQAQSTAPDSQFALGSEYYLAELDLHPDGTATAGGTALMSTVSTESRDKAIAQYRHYLQASPDGRFAEDIMMELQNAAGFVPTQQDHELFARANYAHGHWQAALDEWHKAGNTADWYKQGLCLLRSGKAAAGRAFLIDGIKNHPNDDSVEDAATAVARNSNHDGAVAVWTIVAQKSGRFADIALYNLGTRAATHPASLAYYRQLVTKYPSSKYAPEAAWWLVWEDIKAGRGAQALPQLQSGATRYADARAGTRFAYWTGKMEERLGKKDLAKAAYQHTITMQPWSYYAYRAQSRLAALNGGKDEGWHTIPSRKVAWAEDTAQQWQWPEPPKELAQQEGDTIATLTELRQWDECLDQLPDKKGALRAFYLAKLDEPLQAINAAVPTLKGKPQRTEIWELAYPLLHAKLIAKEGPKKQVDPLLVQALIREESRYNAEAVSSSNALGLMQLLPGTAYGVAKRLGIKLNGVQDVHDPNTNITLGTDYLGYVHRRFNGNSLFAVASYNGGPNAVARWAKTMPADTDVFVENIPYKETRDYVRKVFGSYWNYRTIYQ